MKAETARAVMLGVVMLVAAGCASSEEWATWRQHASHFASGEHFLFSMRNGEGATPTVMRRDVAMAGSEDWWGKVITIDQSAIIER